MKNPLNEKMFSNARFPYPPLQQHDFRALSRHESSIVEFLIFFLPGIPGPEVKLRPKARHFGANAVSMRAERKISGNSLSRGAKSPNRRVRGGPKARVQSPFSKSKSGFCWRFARAWRGRTTFRRMAGSQQKTNSSLKITESDSGWEYLARKNARPQFLH